MTLPHPSSLAAQATADLARAGSSMDPTHELNFATVGRDMLEVRSQAARMAEVDLPVLLIGGNAVAKDAVARLLHKLSPRRKRGFVQVS